MEHMPYSLGVDLGASFTAAAIADDLGTHAAQLSPLLVVPSVIYVSPDGTLLTGDAALRAGESEPSRLVRGFKKRLGDPTPLIIAGTSYTPEQLMAAQLRDIVSEVAAQRGEAAQSIVLTYPVTWGPFRAEHFARIADLAGIDASTTITEPVATATHLNAKGGVNDGDVLAIVDFGTDAVTVTLLRKGADGFSILGTPEDADRGGSADFDDAMRTLCDQKLGGKISALDPTSPTELAMLAAVDDVCRTAKETLSARNDASISVDLPDGAHRLTVTREEFARLIRPSVRLAMAALRRTIGSAEIEEDAVTSIVLTGGASRIPLIAEELAELERPVSAIHHPKLTVALGAAHAARSLGPGPSSSEDDASPRPIVSPVSATGSSTERSFWPPSRRTLIGAAIAGFVVLVVLAVALILPLVSGPPSSLAPVSPTAGEQETEAPKAEVVSPEEAPEAAADIVPTKVSPVVENGTTTAGLYWYISTAGAANDWGVAELHNGVAEMPGIALASTDSGLRAQWSTPNWLSQFYVQLRDEVLDLSEIAAEDGALVFDLTVLSGSASKLQVAAHCVYPCVSSVDITEAVAALEPNTTAHMIVPAQCFTTSGLDATKVNTPFLLIGQGEFTVTVNNIRWENESGAHPDAMTC
ncbi:MAG TPA: hypothetical protein DIW46_11730 [Microbacterium sp.]|nr:hypothetical protein [Microbacterium sp.]